MSRYIIILGLISFFIFFVTIELQPTPQSVLPSIVAVPIEKKMMNTTVTFKDSTLNWRIQNKHQQTSKQLSALTETIGSGICTLDINRDGWMDLFFVGGSGHTRYYGKNSWWLKNTGNRLFLNIKGQYFSDISKESGLTDSIWGMGCSVADFNNDGFSDLFITAVGKNQLYANQADNTFINVTNKSGLSGNNWSMAATLGDYNKDGLLDIYLSNYIDYKKGARTFERTQGFRLTTDISFDATLYDPQPNKLYLNKGNFIFEDVTTQMDVSNPLGRSVGAKWYDLNQDSWLDLIVINAQKSANQVFINHKGKKFSRGEAFYAPLEVYSSHDMLISDFNNNQQDEFFISRSMGYPPVYLKNITSKQSNSNDTFKDDVWSNGLAEAQLLSNNSWAAVTADFNNDSFLDIFIANGMSAPDIDAPFISQGQKNNIFLNDKSSGFKLQPTAFEKNFPYSSRGAITVDLNNDGVIEIVVSNNNSDLQIFENQNKNQNNWLGIDLFTENKSKDIYSATIKLTIKQLTLQQTVQPKQSFLSQSDHRIHFGLEKANIIDTLSIHWPDGKISIFNNIKANQYISINKQTNELITNNTTVTKNTLNKPAYINLNDQSFKALAAILIQYPPKITAQKLIDIWHNSPLKVQDYIVKQLSKNWHSSFLPIVKEALRSNDNQLRLHAIQLLKRSEIESSVNWLIPLLHDSQPMIQCEIAKTFEFYFNEEEAVTHRKFLALSPLIKKLESASDEVKICIINALARAEKKRPVLPLLQLASTSQNPAVKAASIRAMGLIRDKRAIKVLVKIVNNSQTSAQVLASSLIALNRLNYTYLDQLVKLTIIPEVNTDKKTVAMISKSYQVLSYLFNHPDGTVFSNKQLYSLFDNLVKQGKSAKTQESNVIIAKLDTIAAGKLQQHYLLIKPYLMHSNPKVQLHAFKSLASLNNLKARALFENSLLALPLSELIITIKKLGKPQLTLSTRFIKQLIAKANKVKHPVIPLSKLLPLLSKESAKKLFHALVDNKLNDLDMLTLFNECASANIPHLIQIDVNIASLPDESLLAYAICLFSEKESSKVTKNKQMSLKKYQLILTILTNDSFNDNEKSTLLIKAAKGDPLIAKAELLKRIRSLPILHYPNALGALNTHKLTSTLQDYLWETLIDEQLSSEVRLISAKYLVPFEPSKVLAYTNKKYLNYE